MDKLIAARQSTVVNVTSLGYELAECDFDDPNFQVSERLCANHFMGALG